MAWRQGRVLSGLRRLSVLPSLTFEPEIHAENGKFHIPENSSLNLCSSPLNLLYASLTIPLVYCHSKSFQRVSSVARGIVSKPLQKPVDRLTLFQGMS